MKGQLATGAFAFEPGAGVSYHVTRNVAAEDEKGRAVKIALILIKHPNGRLQKACLNEELIRYAGEGIIVNEVKRVAVLPWGGEMTCK